MDDNLLFGADAQSDLVRLMRESAVQINARAVREAAFIIAYCGDDAGRQIVASIMDYKKHQTPWLTRRTNEAIKSFALREFMSRINLNLGGK